ncbi:MAG: hypothetical protein R3F43_19960 [bacterium]
MAIRGKLEHLRLFMVFRSILERRLSGVLTLQAGNVIKRAEIANGYPVRTASNQRQDGLVYALVDEGLISSTEEVELRQQAQTTRTPIDLMVVRMGLVAPKRLAAIQRRVARHLLLEPFGWTDGLYQFEDQVIRPDQGAQGIDLVDLLVEAAGRYIKGPAATEFVAKYARQLVAPTDFATHHAARFDQLFPTPNTRSMLEAPTPFELIARVRGNRDLAAREVAVLVLSGMARFQSNVSKAPEEGRPPEASEPPRPSTVSVRRVARPANVAGTATRRPSVGPGAAPPVFVSRTSAPPAAAPPPAGPTSGVRRAAPPPPPGAPGAPRRRARDARPRHRGGSAGAQPAAFRRQLQEGPGRARRGPRPRGPPAPRGPGDQDALRGPRGRQDRDV